MVLVTAAWRRRGFATALLHDAIEQLRTRALTRGFNSSLPCGARLVLTEPMRGRADPGGTVGVFRLTERPGAACDGPGATARVGIFVDDGRITKAFYPVFPPDRNAAEVVAWLQASR